VIALLPEVGEGNVSLCRNGVAVEAVTVFESSERDRRRHSLQSIKWIISLFDNFVFYSQEETLFSCSSIKMFGKIW